MSDGSYGDESSGAMGSDDGDYGSSDDEYDSEGSDGSDDLERDDTDAGLKRAKRGQTLKEQVITVEDY